MHPAMQHNPTDSDTISQSSLPPVQAQVIAALAQGRTVTAAARDAGLHRSTIYEWLQHEPQFKTAVEDAQREYAALLSDGLRELAATALATMRKLLEDPRTPPAVRLRTALAILQQSNDPGRPWHLPQPIEIPHPAEKIHAVPSADIARGAPCPCGSGIKYKRCCGAPSPGKFTPRGVAA